MSIAWRTALPNIGIALGRTDSAVRRMTRSLRSTAKSNGSGPSRGGSRIRTLIESLTSVPIVGADLGSEAIKVVELSWQEKRPTLRRAVVVPVDTPDLKKILLEAGIRTNYAAVGVASPEILVQPFQFPAMTPEELHSAIQLEAEQLNVNGHGVSDMVTDWHKLGSTEHEVRGVLAVLPKQVKQARLAQARQAGLRPMVVDVEALALWNAYWTLIGQQEEGPGGARLLVNVGACTTNLVIVRDSDTLLLVRDLQLGESALASQGEEWAAEVRDSLRYVYGKTGLRALDRVVLTGGGAGAQACELLESATASSVIRWNPLDSLNRDPSCQALEESVGWQLGVAIGLALRQPS